VGDVAVMPEVEEVVENEVCGELAREADMEGGMMMWDILW